MYSLSVKIELTFNDCFIINIYTNVNFSIKIVLEKGLGFLIIIIITINWGKNELGGQI